VPPDTIISRPANYHPEGVLTSDFIRQEFARLGAQKSFVVPEGIVKIDVGCFRNTDIETVTLPSSLKEIGCEAFRWCKNLKEITLPEGLEIIGIGCFRDTKIKEITIPKSVKSIGNYAFSGYKEDENPNRSLEKVIL
jgi:hypothetical protein